ncbi:MAG: MMPL family transporter [Gammaproteobacteria bacterium]|nr:MMPL family transporter [Gammaproteobacteria bacterium]
MKNLLHYSSRYPLRVLLLMALVTLLFATQLHKLQFSISAQSMMVKNDPLWDTYQKELKTFGADQVTIIYLRDEALFSVENLQLIQQTVQQLESLEFVVKSSSLFNATHFQEIDDLIRSDPFLHVIPQTEEERARIIDAATHTPLIAENLISKDGKSMAINLSIDSSNQHPVNRDHEIAVAIEEVLQPLQQQLDHAFQMSASYVQDKISHQLQQDQLTILPAALVVLIVVLGLSLRSVNCALIPLSTATMSVVITLSMMAMLEIPVNVLTSIIPALLIIIGSTTDVHLMSQYHDGIRSGMSRTEAVSQLPTMQSMAILLAFVTTFFGFLSVTLTELALLREFGWIAAFGLTVNFLITVLFVPAFLTLYGAHTLPNNNRENFYQRAIRSIFEAVMRLKRVLITLLVLNIFVFAWGAQSLQVNNNVLSYFFAESEVKQKAETIHRDLSGMQTFSIIVESGIEGTFLKARYLQEVEKLQQFIEKRAVFDQSFSFANFIQLIHQVMDGTPEPMLPEEDELIQGYMGLVSFDTVKSYVDEQYGATRILVRHNLDSSAAVERELEEIERFIKKELTASLRYEFSGESILTNRAAYLMSVGQFQSLLLMIFVIFLLVSLLFVDLRAGLLALLPNLFPIVVLFGVMGQYNIPLDIGTAMVAVIALGICVDDTIHFLSRYHSFTRGNEDVEMALRQTIVHEATPITTTSIALIFGFLTLTFSTFQPVVYFGALSAMVIFLALFTNFVLTPILLSYVHLITVWDMVSLNLKTAVLSHSKIFQGMRSFQIKQVILTGEIHEHENGVVIAQQGTPADEIYVVLAGNVKVTRKEESGVVYEVRRVPAGGVFGEASLLAADNHFASVSAIHYAKILTIKSKRIHRLERFHPRVALRLFRNLSEILGVRLVAQGARATQREG